MHVDSSLRTLTPPVYTIPSYKDEPLKLWSIWLPAWVSLRCMHITQSLLQLEKWLINTTLCYPVSRCQFDIWSFTINVLWSKLHVYVNVYCEICFINRSINIVQYSNLGLIVATTWYDSLLQLLKKNCWPKQSWYC